jgi:microcystin-dependent protein
MSAPYLGELKLVAFNILPRFWLPCDGRSVSIAQNSALFSLLGTYYGGDGVSNYSLPDLRGRIAVGGALGDPSSLQIGTRGGEETHVLIPGEVPSHSHTPQGSSSPGNQAGVSGGVWAGDSAKLNPPYRSDAPNAVMHPQSTGQTGGGQAHDNMQPFLAMHWIICMQGVFPSRN